MSQQRRYRHWIQPANEGKWPTGIVCLDCTSVAGTRQPGSGCTIERLVGWHGVCMLPKDDCYKVRVAVSGCDGIKCLEYLSKSATMHGNLWIVSYQCNRIWSLLGLWEMIEDGRVKICGSDYRNSQAYRKRLREYRLRQDDLLRTIGGEEERRLSQGYDGYLVCEDTPNILRGRLLGASHAVTWVDIRNYGCEPLNGIEPGMVCVQWMADVIERMCELCRGNGLTALKATAGSQAMSAWRHSYLTEGVYVHTDVRITRIESDSYIGGRCEATRLGIVRDPVWHLDFRSQYGWVCAHCQLPTAPLDYREGGDCRDAIAGERAASAIADVTIETDEPAYPTRRDGEVIYPVGRYRTTLCGPELTDALENGRVLACHSVATYAVGYPLKAYAERLWSMREQCGDGEPSGINQWIKKLIVCLPGKLGQKNHRWVDCPGKMPQCMYGEWYEDDGHGQAIRYRSLGGIVQCDAVDGYAADSVSAISAFVTSYGRMRLLDSIRHAGWYNVYYYDTDSVFVNQIGMDRLRQSPFMGNAGLGQLTLRSQPEQLEIRGVKYYVESGHVTCSGLARGAVTDGGDGVHYTRYLSAVEQARRGHRPEPVTVTGTYERVQAYRGGVVQPDGRVTPFVLR